MTVASVPYPIGTPGVPWGDAERAAWLSRQARSSACPYDSMLRNMASSTTHQTQYRLFAIRSRDWRDDLPVVTTKVYPDSPRTTPEQCNAAQVAAVCAGIEFALGTTRN